MLMFTCGVHLCFSAFVHIGYCHFHTCVMCARTYTETLGKRSVCYMSMPYGLISTLY
uniref:Uncharacterized protein n=1 Tax=Anguilla anguilla TaxID=7936 RepID=A0A0E9TNX7_ANGAN